LFKHPAHQSVLYAFRARLLDWISALVQSRWKSNLFEEKRFPGMIIHSSRSATLTHYIPFNDRRAGRVHFHMATFTPGEKTV